MDIDDVPVLHRVSSQVFSPACYTEEFADEAVLRYRTKVIDKYGIGEWIEPARVVNGPGGVWFVTGTYRRIDWSVD